MMKIIDGQIHLWLPNTPDHPFAPNHTHSHGESYTAETALALFDEAGVTGSVIVTPSWMGTDNSYGLDAAARYPHRFVVMGRFDYAASDARERLACWRDAPGMVGIRATLVDPLTISMFQNPANGAFWARSAALGIPLMCYAPKALPTIADFARRNEGLRIIVDHAGRFAQGPKEEAAWEDVSHLLAMARMPNVAVKVSSLPSFTAQPYPFPILHPYIRAIYDAFGPERMIWGSDVTRLSSTYRENIRLFSEALDFLSEEDKARIFALNLRQWCDVLL
jgi:L-fuconolactonase